MQDGGTRLSNGTFANPDKIGFTVLAKTGQLYYSSNWVYNTVIGGWNTAMREIDTNSLTTVDTVVDVVKDRLLRH